MSWKYISEDKKVIAVGDSELRKLIDDGLVTPTSYVRHKRATRNTWIAAAECVELQPLLPDAPVDAEAVPQEIVINNVRIVDVQLPMLSIFVLAVQLAIACVPAGIVLWLFLSAFF